MKKYRLKKEAIPFVNEKHSNSIYSFDTWSEIGIDINALEEVKAPYISFGIRKNEMSADLAGWDEDGTRLHLTINFPSMKHREHDKFTKGRMVNELIRRLEHTANEYMLNFLEEV